MDRPQKTLADYVVMAVNPALIMLLVGSLVFFLADVLYAGKYGGRLNWTLFWFVFAIVLVGRMGAVGVPHAGIYGLALGVAVWLALTRFVEYDPGGPFAGFSWAINILLIGVVWFCSYKLTHNCTVIEDHEDAKGQGLLDAAGLEDPRQGAKLAREDAEKGGPANQADQLQTTNPKPETRKSTPGVWVIYFSVVALPLFALGQSLIPPEDGPRRRYAFWLMGAYVAGGLGLLLTTSFLALRRYLRQRKLQMPAAMTGMWLAVGGGLALALIVAATVLPRPYSEYSLARLAGLAGSEDQQASKKAILRDGAGKGKGRASKDPKARDANAEKGAGAQKDKEGDQAVQGKQGQGNRGKAANQAQEKGRQGKANDQAQGKAKGNEQGKNQEAENKEQDKGEGDQQADDAAGAETEEAEPEAANWFEQLHSGWLMSAMKWLVYAAVIVVGLYFLLRMLANFSGWASRLLAMLRAFWESLFGKKETAVIDTDAEAPPALLVPRPFAEFRDPFADGRAGRWSASQVVKYSFEALEAWSFERDLPRLPEETPIEFARRLGDEVPALEEHVRQLAHLYAQAAYARVPLKASAIAPLRAFWQQLESQGRPAAVAAD